MAGQPIRHGLCATSRAASGLHTSGQMWATLPQQFTVPSLYGIVRRLGAGPLGARLPSRCMRNMRVGMCDDLEFATVGCQVSVPLCMLSSGVVADHFRTLQSSCGTSTASLGTGVKRASQQRAAVIDSAAGAETRRAPSSPWSAAVFPGAAEALAVRSVSS